MVDVTKRILVVVFAAGCAPQTHYTVSRMTGPFGAIDNTCEYDDNGYVGCSGASNGVPWSMQSAVDGELPPDGFGAANSSDQVVPNGLSRLAPPTAGDVARAIAAPAIRDALAACRADYGIDVASVSAQITVAPSGAIAKVALAAANDSLGACVAHALHRVALTAYSGDAVTFDEAVSL
ncbi:MAG TPA: hypothetical protein VGL61_17720 [Kofleriaceae bacterium]|jgi:hypothetical protein